jgi:hypothetical protein
VIAVPEPSGLSFSITRTSKASRSMHASEFSAVPGASARGATQFFRHPMDALRKNLCIIIA